MENRILRNTFRAQLLAFVLSSLASAIGTMVDGVIIGQCLGMDSIAAFGLVSPLMIVFALGGAVVSSGARNRFTHLVGSGEVRQAQAVFSLACVLSVGVGTAMMAVCLVFASPIVRMLGATGNAAWYAFPVTQLLMLLFYCAVVQISRRRSGFPGSAGFDLALLLPQDFDAGEEDRMDRSIRSMEEVAALSQEVWAFCDAHGCDARRRNLLSLAVEEMAGNVVEHGFTKDQKTHSLDV